ncbi:hypothetical protein CR513_36479, partial [Mucuna pruriens]
MEHPKMQSASKETTSIHKTPTHKEFYEALLSIISYINIYIEAPKLHKDNINKVDPALDVSCPLRSTRKGPTPHGSSLHFLKSGNHSFRSMASKAYFLDKASTTMFAFPCLCLTTYGKFSRNSTHLACLGRTKSLKKGNESLSDQKEEKAPPISNSSRSSNIKGFKCLGKRHIISQCPSKRTMILRENVEIESESSQEDSSSSSEVESFGIEPYYESDLLMVRRLVNNLVREEVGTQRENIFLLGALCWENCALS